MPTINKKINFFESEAGEEFERNLKLMVADSGYCTDASYSTNSELYPDNLIPFVDKHMHYMRTHPSTDPVHYMANLRLMTRVR